jgi:hypothetical protein
MSLWTLFNTASSAATEIPLFWRRMSSKLEQLRLRHWLSDDLTTWLDLIYKNGQGTVNRLIGTVNHTLLLSYLRTKFCPQQLSSFCISEGRGNLISFTGRDMWLSGGSLYHLYKKYRGIISWKVTRGGAVLGSCCYTNLSSVFSKYQQMGDVR